MFEKLKSAKSVAMLGLLLVLLLFWHPVWGFVIDIISKVKGVIPEGK
jgi:hypothetical protein